MAVAADRLIQSPSDSSSFCMHLYTPEFPDILLLDLRPFATGVFPLLTWRLFIFCFPHQACVPESSQKLQKKTQTTLVEIS